MNGLVALVVWKSDLRHFIVLFNILAILAIGGFLAWTVFSRRAPRQDARERDALPLRRRPRRPAARACARVEPHVRHAVRGGDARVHGARAHPSGPLDRRTSRTVRSSAARTLFANPASEFYNSVLSLQCANCHGSEGGGGSTTAVIDPDGPEGPQPPESFIVEGARAQHRAVALLAGRGRADHHLRPAGHTDASVRGARRWRRERRRPSRTSSRTSSRSSCRPRRRKSKPPRTWKQPSSNRRCSWTPRKPRERRSEHGRAHHRRDGARSIRRRPRSPPRSASPRRRATEELRGDVRGPRDALDEPAGRPTRGRPPRPRPVATS